MTDFIRKKNRTPSPPNNLSFFMRRAHARLYRETPIQFCLPHNPKAHRGIMRNESIGGMCFKTSRKLDPGTTIRIKIIEPSPDLPDTFYNAEVKWCRQNQGQRPESFRFGVGIKYHRKNTPAVQ